VVAHWLRLKGFAEAGLLAELSGLAPAVVEACLGELAASGEAVRREGRISGWSLTASGRAADTARVSAELEATEFRAVVEAAYADFGETNAAVLAACTDWQLRSDLGDAQVLNDHRDPAYDDAVIARLAAVDASAQGVCARLAESFDRFAGYGPRLAKARAEVEGGNSDFFTGPLIESYHTVWFELHEDLLATLGIEREKEGLAV